MRISYLIFAAGPALLVFFFLISNAPAVPVPASIAESEMIQPAAHGKMCALPRNAAHATSCTDSATPAGEIVQVAFR